MVSAVGDDARGREAIEMMQSYGIDVSSVQVIAEAPTGAVGVTLDDFGKPTFTIHEGSAWDRLAWTPELERQTTEADAVYFGTLGQRGEMSRNTIRRALQVAEHAGVSRVLDVNLRPPFFDASLIRESVGSASILKLSDDELSAVCAACGLTPASDVEQSLHHLLDALQLDLVVMTRGPDGAILVSPGQTVDQSGIPTTVRDTVGAGDSFTASLVLGLLRGETLEGALLQACETASTVCSHSGAVP